MSGPPGIVDAGRTISFTVQVENSIEKTVLQYSWEASTGKIVEGQGTATIQVLARYREHVAATVTIKGLPVGCPNNASVAYFVDIVPAAIKADELIGPLDEIASERFEKIINTGHLRPDAQLYVIISGTQQKTLASIRRKRDIIIDQILRKLGEDATRVTFIDSSTNDDRVVIWLVPPGATPPSFAPVGSGEDSSKIQSCPEISVLASDGVPQLDKPVTFSATVIDEKQPERLSYHWLINHGTILSGQGTKSIQVKIKSRGETLTATVEISGLPTGCRNDASGSADID